MPRLLSLLLVCLLASGGSPPAAAATTTLQVQAVILPSVNVQVRSAPAVILVTQDDVSRGYVDVVQPLTLAVRSNLAHGVLLAISADPSIVQSTHVRGAAGVGAVGSGAMFQLPPAVGVQLVDLRLRFYLASGVLPGEHPWPVRVATSA